jgi:hypothetical protein
VFWVISVYFTIRNILPKCDTFLLGHPVYIEKVTKAQKVESRKGRGQSSVSISHTVHLCVINLNTVHKVLNNFCCYNVGFEVLTAETMKIAILCIVTPYSVEKA